MLLAGIYTYTADGRWTFTILTKAATSGFAKIHNDKKRRPIIIPKEKSMNWLNPNHTQQEVLQLLENDLDDSHLQAHPVSKDLYLKKEVAQNDSVIEKMNYPEVTVSF